MPYVYKQIFVRKATFLHYLGIDFLSLCGLGIFFSVIAPWEVPDGLGWNQAPLGRSIVALFRLFLDVSMAIFVHFCITTGKVSLKTILNMAIVIAFVQIGVGLLDYFTNYPIRSNLFTERMVPGRFLGMSHEPRSMARNTAFVLILTFAAYFANSKKFKIGLKHIFILLFGVLFTASTSSMIAVGMSGFLFFLIKNKKNRFAYLFSFILIGFISFQIISTTEHYQTKILGKMTKVALGGLEYGIIKGEPLWITRLEVLDRAAANFFYRYPGYLWLGTGPNLIGLPSSPYRTKSALESLGEVIVSVPGTGLVYTLSRNGILGLVILFFLYRFLYKKNKTDQLRGTILFFTFVFYLFIHPDWFFFNIGLVSSYSKLN